MPPAKATNGESTLYTFVGAEDNQFGIQLVHNPTNQHWFGTMSAGSGLALTQQAGQRERERERERSLTSSFCWPKITTVAMIEQGLRKRAGPYMSGAEAVNCTNIGFQLKRHDPARACFPSAASLPCAVRRRHAYVA
eukprot:366115-Chlamydomonas_euryale.AAC.7